MFNLPKRLLNLVLIATVIRVIVGAVLELGNDEVYYYIYSLDLSANYFDHPPGVAFLIRLFTFNNLLTQELFVRLGAIVSAALGTILTYRLGAAMKNEQTGWFAALLYNSSIYASVIAGTFIVPDSPQVVFWLASLWVMYTILSKASRSEQIALPDWLLFGLLAGLTILCKVHGIFLWGGFGLYILLFDWKLFSRPGLYLSALLTLVVISPIFWWNIQNDFITYRYQSGRMGVEGSLFHLDYFAQIAAGQILYNNPINSGIIILALWKLRTVKFIDLMPARFILINGLPMVLVVTGMGLFNSVLPHWSGPGFLALAFLAAAYLDETMKNSSRKMPLALTLSVGLTTVALVLATLLIKFYPGTLGSTDRSRYGEGDFTLDMYGWRQLRREFKPWLEEQERSGVIGPGIKLVTYKWFPGAHVDYYVAGPLRKPLIGVGTFVELHQYVWTNRVRPSLEMGEDALCIVPSNYPGILEESYARYFASMEALHTFTIFRSGQAARYFTVYRLQGYKMNDDAHRPEFLE